MPYPTRNVAIILLLLLASPAARAQTMTVSGHITDAATGEALIGATAYADSLGKGTSANLYGFYSLTLPRGRHRIVFSFIGYKDLKLTVTPADTSVDAHLEPSSTELAAVVVEAPQRSKTELRSTGMSTIRIPVSQITGIPSLGGETDIIKVMQLMPGVAAGGEGGTSLFVRGGDADQNLVLLDEAVVYNVGHLFGFFSVFNPDAINDLQMIKGAFPANYGGRLSSVLDIRMKEGDMSKMHASGGIGLLSSRLTLEGPVFKEKVAFIVSARRTYIDQVFKLMGVNLPYYFYDINIKTNWKVGKRDRLFFSSYVGKDVLKVKEKVESDSSASAFGDPLNFGFELGNNTTTLRWNHIFRRDKLFSNISVTGTRFSYDVNGSFLDNSVLIRSDIADNGVKIDFDYYRKPESHMKFGFHLVNHTFRPNVVSTAGEISDYLASKPGDAIETTETALYFLNDFEVTPLLKVNYGFRLSGATVQATEYGSLEPRFAARYLLSDRSTVKLSWSRMVQYMHRVSSSTIALPTDLWYPVTAQVQPQKSGQLSAAWIRELPRPGTTLTVEAFGKSMKHLIEYREGANLILNENFEDELLSGKGYSYGTEVLLRKDEGRLSGWIGYTLSWSVRDFDSLNAGEPFYAKYDRRHNFSVVATWTMSRRWDLSAVWVYMTGARFTAQVGQYFMPNATLTDVDVIPIYTARNAVKMSPTHRLDVNFILKPRPGKGKRFRSEWHFGAYNLYARAAPYRINVVPDGRGGYKYTQPGLFGFILSVAYNFTF